MPDSNRIYNASLVIAGNSKTETVPLTGRGVRIAYTRVPTIASPDYLQGIATGVNPSAYRVVSYVHTDRWYIKPFNNSSAKRPVASTGAWKCDIDNQPTDVLAAGVASFLVPKNDDLPPLALDSLDDSRMSQYDRISANKPKLGITKVTAKAGDANDDLLSISGRYYVDMLEILSADFLCVNVLQEDNSLWQICVPFDFIKFVRGNGFVYDRGDVYIRLSNVKRVSDSFAGNFKIRINGADLTGLRSPLSLNLVIGNFDQTAVADESVDSGIINGVLPVPLQFLSGSTDALRVDTMKLKPDSKNRGSLYVRGAMVFQNTFPDLIEQDVVVNIGGNTFTIPAGNFKKYGSSGLKYRCTNVPVTQGGLASASFNFHNSTFWVKIIRANINEASGAVAFNLAMGAFSEGVCVNR
jgi:hypothetical protein